MRVTVPRSPPSRATITVTITHKAEPVAETVAFLSSLVFTLADAAANGAFRTGFLHESQSYAAAPQRLTGGPNQTVISMDVNAVDLRFVECLRSACEVQELSDQITSIAIDTDPASGDVATIAHPSGVEGRHIYPPFLTPRFRIEEEYDSATRMHQIIVDLSAPVGASDIAGLAAFVAPWGMLLEAGCFALPNLEPTLTYSIMGPTKMFEADSIEILIDRYDADLEGMNALLNMIDTYAARTPGVRSAVLY